MERSEGAEGREEIPARRLCGGHAKTGPARQLAIGDYLQRTLAASVSIMGSSGNMVLQSMDLLGC